MLTLALLGIQRERERVSLSLFKYDSVISITYPVTIWHSWQCTLMLHQPLQILSRCLSHYRQFKFILIFISRRVN